MVVLQEIFLHQLDLLELLETIVFLDFSPQKVVEEVDVPPLFRKMELLEDLVAVVELPVPPHIPTPLMQDCQQHNQPHLNQVLLDHIRNMEMLVEMEVDFLQTDLLQVVVVALVVREYLFLHFLHHQQIQIMVEQDNHFLHLPIHYAFLHHIYQDLLLQEIQKLDIHHHQQVIIMEEEVVVDDILQVEQVLNQ
jgi:hypothetical protein